jgi:hypothetical protein
LEALAKSAASLSGAVSAAGSTVKELGPGRMGAMAFIACFTGTCG